MVLFLALLFLAALGAYLWWDRSSLYVNSAHRAFVRGDENATLAAFAKAEAAGRLSAEATASYAYLLLKAGQTEAAGALLRGALDHGRKGRSLKEPERRLLVTYLALVLWKEGDLDRALTVLLDLHREGYQTTNLYGNLGFLLPLAGRLDEAEALCVEAQAWNPTGKVILDNLAALRWLQGRKDEAADLYGQLTALDPKFPEAWYGAGRAALHQGHPDLAADHFRRALGLPFHQLTTVTRDEVEAALASLGAAD